MPQLRQRCRSCPPKLLRDLFSVPATLGFIRKVGPCPIEWEYKSAQMTKIDAMAALARRIAARATQKSSTGIQYSYTGVQQICIYGPHKCYGAQTYRRPEQPQRRSGKAAQAHSTILLHRRPHKLHRRPKDTLWPHRRPEYVHRWPRKRHRHSV